MSSYTLKGASISSHKFHVYMILKINKNFEKYNINLHNIWIWMKSYLSMIKIIFSKNNFLSCIFPILQGLQRSSDSQPLL